eukprot:CAMPEP_0198723866 /NCGR_PEP_ID=MMETSP1475-20131203/1356_1 /TAXON_ID= ORGANISM="Unidentified sp., Strain CCMP1999" /NCGR_SAMPLE_ID=MMETSP1475 /ASSEMBLY_ACC=CAM_ASM_001111 /LENGTH=216 /DNA_ID=CAMNT_0044485181 /DNA_START=504 /DNA_END=1154 /DNA_ORIENTATION=+
MFGFVSGVGSFTKPVLARSGFAGCRVYGAPVRASAGPKMQVLGVFKSAMEDFKKEFPLFAKRGWGATVKAEGWNGRHAMFGFLALWITAYMHGHGLIPGGQLDLSQWGRLADLGGNKPIPNERAIILIAHVHVLLVSVAAAIAPFSFQDRLLLEPGEKDPEPVGLIPPLKFGLTKEAELWNGRLAMLGIISLVGASFATGEPFLDLMNKMFGNVFY